MWEEPWREVDVEPPPKNRVILLFALVQGRTNWKMATGWWSTAYEGDAEHSHWHWDGRQLAPYDEPPTHWMPLPEPPVGVKE